MPTRIRALLLPVFVGLAASLLPTPAAAVPIGFLAFAAGEGAAATPNALDIYNASGADALAPDYPIATAVTFQGWTLTLNYADSSLSPVVIHSTDAVLVNDPITGLPTPSTSPLGDIGGGFFWDGGLSPYLNMQFGSDAAFASAEFQGTLSDTNLMLTAGDGTLTPFLAAPTIVAMLLPASGDLLGEGDGVYIDATAASTQQVPEPATFTLLVTGVTVAFANRRLRQRG